MTPTDSRVAVLETNYTHILSRLDDLDGRMEGLDTMKHQIEGIVSVIKFVGWGGIGTGCVVLLRHYMANPQ